MEKTVVAKVISELKPVSGLKIFPKKFPLLEHAEMNLTPSVALAAIGHVVFCMSKISYGLMIAARNS